jgi:hypothetical protein
MVCLVEGVPQGYLAATTAAALRSQLAVAT